MVNREYNGFRWWFFIKIVMATITYHNVGIKAMSACVPSKIAYNRDLNAIMEQEEVDKVTIRWVFMRGVFVNQMFVHLIYVIRQQNG